MKISVIRFALVAAALMLGANTSLAAESNPAAPQEAGKTGAAAKKAPAKAELVDINSASKAELKKLPGVRDAEADKIVAGRPYLSKAHLVTRNIISQEVYDGIRTLIVAKQKPEQTAKPAAKK